MVLTRSNMLPLGSRAPNFALPDTDDKLVLYADFRGSPAKVVMFICNHCPYVKHIRAELVYLAKEYMKKNVAFIAVNSNDASEYPDDSLEKMKLMKYAYDFPFPYLFDEEQTVAKAFEAACTPEFFLFDKQDKLFYHGRFDDSKPNSGTPVTGRELREALDGLLEGKSPPATQQQSVGCNIKWKTANEPKYFTSLELYN